MKNLKITSLALAMLIGLTFIAEAKPPKAKKSNTPVAPAEPAKPKLANASDSACFYLGIYNAKQMFAQPVFPDKSFNLEAFYEGMKLVKANADSISEETLNIFLYKFFDEKQKEINEKALAENRKFFEENGKREGVVTLPDGLQYRIITPGTGAKPKADDNVEIHYVGTLIDGTKFDSSRDRNEPATMSVGGVIKGFSEALQMMSEGAKWEVFIPSELGYGERGAGNTIKPNSITIFEIELLRVIPHEHDDNALPQPEVNHFNDGQTVE